MTAYDSIEEDICNIINYAHCVESDMKWALKYPEESELSEEQKKIFEHNLPIFKEINARLKGLKG